MTGISYFAGTFVLLLVCQTIPAQLILPGYMNLGEYNSITKQYEKKSNLLGGDDHDKIPHRRPILGGDDHDLKPHHQHLLGGDDHDKIPHHRPNLGGDDHDLKPHRQHLLGGDDHDKIPHHRPNLGGDDHDLKPHHQHLLGGDDHDKIPHRRPNLGGDDHDLKPHHRPNFGGDDHDFKPHHRPNLGGDDHDFKPHHRPNFGGDDHDFKPHHRPNLGRDDHDLKPHHQHLLGGDDHDHQTHGLGLIGIYHNHLPTISQYRKKPWLGGGDHDKKPHNKRRSALSLFREFTLKHNKQYSGQAVFRRRFSIFRHNLQRIKQMQRNEQGTATYGITKFADLSAEEFQIMQGFRPSMRRKSVHRQQTVSVPDVALPVAFDWRDHGVVTEVKNQAMCGSCWAFSATGNVEGQWALKHSDLVSLSEQELVDCDSEDQGCEGGLPENAYDAIMKMGGLETETDYPYSGKDGTCHMEKAKSRVQVNGSVELPQDEDQLARWLFKNGPVSIGINANALQFYTGGVSHPLRFLCSPTQLNHGMLIVGFGTHTTRFLHRKQPYWLVKNSWGTDWGEKGYYRVYRGDSTCGVNQMATSSIVP